MCIITSCRNSTKAFIRNGLTNVLTGHFQEVITYCDSSKKMRYGTASQETLPQPTKRSAEIGLAFGIIAVGLIASICLITVHTSANNASPIAAFEGELGNDYQVLIFLTKSI